MQPVGELTWSSGIAKACQDHVMDHGPIGARGHDGTDGSDPGSRMARYGRVEFGWSENCAYGVSTGI